MFTDDELEMMVEAIAYWWQVVEPDMSSVERRMYDSINAKLDRELNP